MNQININLPAIRNIAVRGVRRTAIFMGLGINAANNPDFKQYELAKLTGFEFIEPISDERTLAGLKTEFGRWIVGNGLRELIETFCIFLDEIHVACLWMSASCHKIPLNQIQTQDKKFRHKGLKDKLPHLKKHLQRYINPTRFYDKHQSGTSLSHPSPGECWCKRLFR